MILAVLMLVWVGTASAQSAGVGGPYFRDDCETLTAHVTNQILCWDQTAAALKTWNGSAWVGISSGSVTNVGTLTTNAFIIGQGSASIAALVLTGYVKGNGASIPTASATIPATDLSGTLAAAQFPALTGDVTTSAGSLATSLSLTGVSAGTYGQVTVDTKGRVTAGTTVTDMAHGGTDLSTAADDTILISSGSAWQAKALPSCSGANQALNYTTGTNTPGCVTISVGTGSVTNTGTLTANRFILGNGGVDVTAAVSITGLVLGAGASAPSAYAGTSCADPTYVQSINASGVATCNTPAGSGDVSHPAGVLTSNAFILGDGGGQIKAQAITGYVKGAGASAPSGVTTIPVADGGTGIAAYVAGDLITATGTTTLARIAGAALGQVLISQGPTTPPVWSAHAFLSDSVRTPLVFGDVTPGGGLQLRSTAGVGTTDAIVFQVGNNGATESARIVSSGRWGINSTAPTHQFTVVTNGTTTPATGTSGLAVRLTTGNNPFVITSEITSGTAWFGFGANQSTGNLQTYATSLLQPIWRFSQIGNVVNALRLQVAAAGTAGSTITWTNALDVDTTGSILKVYGIVESTTGGFKFPDATTQTTAAVTASVAGATGRIGVFTGTNTIGSFSNLVRDSGTGFVGIGTATPASGLDSRVATIISTNASTLPATLGALHVSAVTNTQAAVDVSSFGAQSGYICRRATGSPTVRSAVFANDPLCALQGGGAYDSSNYAVQASYGFFASENWTGSVRGSYTTVGFTAVGDTTIAEATRFGAPPGASVTGSTVNTSTTISSIQPISNLTGGNNPTSGIVAGMRVTGSGIPAGATVVSVGASSIVISAAATATASGVQLALGDRPTFQKLSVPITGAINTISLYVNGSDGAATSGTWFPIYAAGQFVDMQVTGSASTSAAPTAITARTRYDFGSAAGGHVGLFAANEYTGTISNSLHNEVYGIASLNVLDTANAGVAGNNAMIGIASQYLVKNTVEGIVQTFSAQIVNTDTPGTGGVWGVMIGNGVDAAATDLVTASAAVATIRRFTATEGWADAWRHIDNFTGLVTFRVGNDGTILTRASVLPVVDDSVNVGGVGQRFQNVFAVTLRADGIVASGNTGISVLVSCGGGNNLTFTNGILTSKGACP